MPGCILPDSQRWRTDAGKLDRSMPWEQYDRKVIGTDGLPIRHITRQNNDRLGTTSFQESKHCKNSSNDDTETNQDCRQRITSTTGKRLMKGANG
jgi:hypothetical protein